MPFKSDQKGWKNLTLKWENPKIQDKLEWFAEKILHPESLEPQCRIVIGNMLSVVAESYSRASGYVSVTARLYSGLTNEIVSSGGPELPEMLTKELPREFTESSILNGRSKGLDGNGLTLSRAKKLYSFMESTDFNHVIKIMEDMQFEYEVRNENLFPTTK
jgi:hypothetical protein